MSSQLTRIFVRNLRKIASLDVAVGNESVICFIGPNGSGKSSLMTLLDACYRNLIHEDGDDVGNNSPPRTLSSAEVRSGCDHLVVAFSFGDKNHYTYVAKIHEDVKIDFVTLYGEFFSAELPEKQLYSGWIHHRPKGFLNDMVFLYRPSVRTEKPSYSNPHAVRDHRRYKRLVARRTLPTHVEQGLPFAASLMYEIIFDKLFDRSGITVGTSASDAAVSEWAFGSLTDIFRTITGSENASFNIDRWPYREVHFRGVSLEFMSEGEIDVAITALHILGQQIEIMRKRARTLSTLPPVPGGVCIIDEVDAHLHPSAQSKIVPLLTKIFPSITFVISTHSPFVLQSLSANTSLTIRLPDGAVLDHDFSIWPVEDILRIAFDAPQWGHAASELISGFQTLVRSSKLAEALEIYQKIQGTGPALRSVADRILFVDASTEFRSTFIDKNKDA